MRPFGLVPEGCLCSECVVCSFLRGEKRTGLGPGADREGRAAPPLPGSAARGGRAARWAPATGPRLLSVRRECGAGGPLPFPRRCGASGVPRRFAGAAPNPSPCTLSQGAQVDSRDHSGATAQMLARQCGHMKIVGLIDAHSPSLPRSLYRSPGTRVPASPGDPVCSAGDSGVQPRLGLRPARRRPAPCGGGRGALGEVGGRPPEGALGLAKCSDSESDSWVLHCLCTWVAGGLPCAVCAGIGPSNSGACLSISRPLTPRGVGLGSPPAPGSTAVGTWVPSPLCAALWPGRLSQSPRSPSWFWARECPAGMAFAAQTLGCPLGSCPSPSVLSVSSYCCFSCMNLSTNLSAMSWWQFCKSSTPVPLRVG